MRNDEKLLDKLESEVQDIEKQYRDCFEAAMCVGYEASSSALDGLADWIVSVALGSAASASDDDEARSASEAAEALQKLAKKSMTKRRLLASVALGRVYLRNVIRLAEDGDLVGAISALAAAAMTSGAIQVAKSEIEAKAAPGKSSSAKRKETYEKRASDALAQWRAEIPLSLSAEQAAEKLRAMGIPLSHDKLARIVSAEKKAIADNTDGASPDRVRIYRLKRGR